MALNTINIVAKRAQRSACLDHDIIDIARDAQADTGIVNGARPLERLRYFLEFIGCIRMSTSFLHGCGNQPISQWKQSYHLMQQHPGTL